ADRELTDELARAVGEQFAGLLAAERATQVAGLAAFLSSDDGVPSSRRRNPLGPIRVAVGRDGRLASDRLHRALTAGLGAGGAAGLSSGAGRPPLLSFAAHHPEPAGAAMITASHNPGPDNGFKMMRGKASFFGADVQALADRLEAASDVPLDAGARAGRIE